MTARAALVLWASTAALVGCTGGAAPPPPGTVLVDLNHRQSPKGTPAPVYPVDARDTLQLDARRYDFSQSDNPQAQTNVVHVLIGQQQYIAPWNRDGVVELSRRTLIPVNQSPSFTGFKPGDMVLLGIGEQHVDAATKVANLRLQWSGVVAVQ